MRPFIISLARDFGKRDRRLAKTVERVRDRAQHIADIVRTEKSLGGSGMSLKDINLRNALSDAIKVVQDSMDSGRVRVDVDCAEAPKEIKTQESQFRQMMINVIKNSAQAIHELAESDGLEDEPRIRIRARIDGEFLNLEVSDNGVGFSSKDTRKFFAAGYTTKESGTGLGLHSAANFIVGSGGWIELLSDGAPARERPRASSCGSLRGRRRKHLARVYDHEDGTMDFKEYANRRVLIVDDQKEIHDDFIEMLTHQPSEASAKELAAAFVIEDEQFYLPEFELLHARERGGSLRHRESRKGTDPFLCRGLHRHPDAPGRRRYRNDPPYQGGRRRCRDRHHDRLHRQVSARDHPERGAASQGALYSKALRA